MKKKARLWTIGCALLAALILGVLGLTYRLNQIEWVDIGPMVTYLEKQGHEEIQKIPYRFYDFSYTSGVIKSNVDIADLQLAVSSGAALSKRVMIGVYRCWSPDVRQGFPSVYCPLDGGDIYISGDNDTRSKLMHLEKNQKGSLIGVVVGQYGGSPIVKVL